MTLYVAEKLYFSDYGSYALFLGLTIGLSSGVVITVIAVGVTVAIRKNKKKE